MSLVENKLLQQTADLHLSSRQKEQFVSFLTTSLQICESKKQKEMPCVFVGQL